MVEDSSLAITYSAGGPRWEEAASLLESAWAQKQRGWAPRRRLREHRHSRLAFALAAIRCLCVRTLVSPHGQRNATPTAVGLGLDTYPQQGLSLYSVVKTSRQPNWRLH